MAKKFLTKQQIFDKVANHLLTQNKQSINKKGDCLYRGPKGLKCAIGCLIPDKKYNKKLENQRVDEKIAEICGIDSSSEQTVHFLEDLQWLHDTSYPEDWKRELRIQALKHNLKTKILNKFEKDNKNV